MHNVKIERNLRSGEVTITTPFTVYRGTPEKAVLAFERFEVLMVAQGKDVSGLTELLEKLRKI